MTFGQVRRIVVISVLIVLFWVWIDPAFAVVLGIISMGVLSVANRHPKPRWIQKFWALQNFLGRGGVVVPFNDF